ncbi:hypothetical protein FK538_06870 [Acinetobacter indicus]|uniref:hypothetical protein n=1 Tax=Acinetobacter indicus TaxID=756892 RepID=UPI00143FFB2C|nr:hypothetical protein [Acinetobacter indicus]QIZ61739.1 hypothetical protein FK538_06870 [Acinetobacter indicus]
MKKILLLLLISSNLHATELTLNIERPKYKVEYDPKTQTIKILSKTNGNKACDKKATSNSTKALIEKSLKDRSKKTIINFTCFD